MKTLDLFSGIGGFTLAGQSLPPLETTQFVEIDPFCQKVLSKNFPHIPIHGDIRTFTANFGDFDLITAGFPCQDVSTAGAKAGLLVGNRSGLFHEVVRTIGVVQPKFVLLENVPGLLNRGMDIVLGELSSIGYDCEWQTISCAEIGGTHRRDRVWIIAYPNSQRRQCSEYWESLSDQDRNLSASQQARRLQPPAIEPVNQPIAYPNSVQCLQGQWLSTRSKRARQSNTDGTPRDFNATHSHCQGLENGEWKSGREISIGKFERSNRVSREREESQPSICRTDDGLSTGVDRHLLTLENLQNALPIAAIDEKVPHHKDRLKALGNSIVPQVALIPLRRILELNQCLLS